MNYIANTTVGIDTVIASLQSEFYDLISTLWQGEVNGYGRVYRNKGDNGIVPEWYAGEREYEPVYYDDMFAGNFFFIDGDSHPTSDEFCYTSDVKVCFMVNLAEILPNETGRADAKAQEDIVRALRAFAYERYTITGIEKGIENVLRGFDTSQIQFEDIHPKHTFAVNLKLAYYINN